MKRDGRLWQIRSLTIGAIILISTAFVAAAMRPANSAPASPYVDPTLLTGQTDQLAVIVTGRDSAAAAQAVRDAGGILSSDLWLIQAVGARLTADQLAVLRADSRIVSIVRDSGVTAAAPAQCSGGMCASRPGWITDRREKQALSNVPGGGHIKAQVAQMPDGGVVAVAQKQVVVYLNPDLTLRTVVTNLIFEKMETTPDVGADGSLYFVGEELGTSTKMILYALNPDGSTRWFFKQNNLLPGAALSPDGAFVYVLSHEPKAKLYVFSAETGDLIAKVEPPTSRPGLVEQPPLVAPDGRVYVQSSGHEPDKFDRRGNLLALDPALFLVDDHASAWRFIAATGSGEFEENYELDYAPVLANGLLYAFSDHDKRFFAINPDDGALQFSVVLPRAPEAQPVAGADGTIYIPADKCWYAYNPDGTLRYEYMIPDGKFGSPVFSADGTTIYTAAAKTLYALDTATGAARWSVDLKGDIKKGVALDPDGNVIVGSDGKDMVIVTPTGTVTSRLRLDNKFGQVISADLPGGAYLILVGETQLLRIGPMAEQWDANQHDVQPTEIKDEWELVNPIAIDVGADVVQNTELLLPDEDGDLTPTRLSGAGVAIAVIDSGIYVDGKVKDLLSSDLYATDIDNQYAGQYDFVGNGFDPATCSPSHYHSAEGYCYYDWDKSQDDYGHGSHVAGIIWSQITDASTSASMGIAPGAEVISLRVLDGEGHGSYEDVIQAIQFAVQGIDEEGDPFDPPIRILNLSLSGHAATPYFVDPLNRAVEAAWQAGLVVLAAAGNEGPGAQTITAPGNDPYIITVGALNNQRTPGYWGDDIVPNWSASGPTLDGFVKPDVLAPGAHIVSFMHNEGTEVARILRDHPDYVATLSLFRMNGTSMATAVTSGVAALMLQANPNLTPDQVKFRLMYTAAPAINGESELAYSPLRQGAGRVWAPAAVLATNLPDGVANQGLDLAADLAHPWHPGDSPDPEQNPDLAFHYTGPVHRILSDDGETYLFFVVNPENGALVAVGAAAEDGQTWLDPQAFLTSDPQFGGGQLSYGSGSYLWGGGSYLWGGGSYLWGGGSYLWGGGSYLWGGNTDWVEGLDATSASISSNTWVEDEHPVGYTTHVADLDGGSAWVSNSGWAAAVGVTVRDEFRTRVPEATVQGVWQNGAAGSCVTAVNGECIITSASLAEGVSSWRFSVTGIEHATQSYVSADNEDLDGDSDGFEVTSARPTVRPKLHVGDLDRSSAWVSSSAWSGAIVITLHDDQEQPVPGATVNARWKSGLSGNISCVTDANSQCTIAAPPVSDSISKIELEVLSLQHPLLYYQTGLNHDPDGESNGVTIQVLPPTDRPKLHVGDLDRSSAWVSSSAWSGTIVITLHDNQEQPVPGATVNARWKSGLVGNIACVTDANSQCTIAAPSVSDSISKIELEILSLQHPMLYYQTGLNHDPDGESNGTTIQVLPPAYRPGMQISAMIGAAVMLDASSWQAQFTITVLDDNLAPVSNVIVNSKWTKGLSGLVSCVTDSSGQCSISGTVPVSQSQAKLQTLSLSHAMLVNKGSMRTVAVDRP